MRNDFNELLSERLKEISKQEKFNQLMFVLVEDIADILRFIIEELGDKKQ